jgi:hypothetical protein
MTLSIKNSVGAASEEFRELVALGLPPVLIARRLGLSPSVVYARFTGRTKCPSTARQRETRVARIKANIAQFPGVSYCYPEASN